MSAEKMDTCVALYLDLNPEWIAKTRLDQGKKFKRRADIVLRLDGVDYELTFEQLVAYALEHGVRTDIFGK